MASEAAGTHPPASTEVPLVDFAEAVAEDAEMLAALHDRELTITLMDSLRDTQFPFCLGLLPGKASASAWEAMSQAIALLSNEALDCLHADYAAIYLTGALGVSPCESVWTDDDGLICQAAMFEMRKIYAADGLGVENWRKRPDDHLVVQLLYIAAIARRAQSLQDWEKLGGVLDHHLLRWLPEFAARIAQRSGSTFYTGLAILSVEWLETLRDRLVSLTGSPRSLPPEVSSQHDLQLDHPCDGSPPASYLPGTAPSW